MIDLRFSVGLKRKMLSLPFRLNFHDTRTRLNLFTAICISFVTKQNK